MSTFSSALSSRSQRLYDSGIKEMIEMVHRYGALSFTAGEPSDDLIQKEQLRQAICESFESSEDMMSYYHDPTGLTQLKEWIVAWMNTDGLLPSGLDVKNVMLTSGSQEGLNLITEAVVNEGDLVITEDPSYPEAFLTFSKEGSRLEGVHLDAQGPSVEAIEHIAKNEKIKMFYTIPCFQNPSGSVTSLRRRKDILALARRYDFLILEDDPYRHLWFSEPPPSSYISLPNNDGRVIYMGSFSKVIAPGIRCGWIIAPDWISSTLLRLRVASHLNLPTLMHQGILNYVTKNPFHDYVSGLRKTYATRRDTLVQSLKHHISKNILTFDVPQGGFFLWGNIPILDDAGDFARYSIHEEGIGILDGSIFSVGLKTVNKSAIRLSFAKIKQEEAEEGCLRLARAISKYCRIQTQTEYRHRGHTYTFD